MLGEAGKIRLAIQQTLVQLKGEIAVLNADEGITDLIALQFLVEKAHLHFGFEHLLLKAFEPFAAGGEVEQVLGGPPLALKVGLLFRCGADLQFLQVVLHLSLLNRHGKRHRPADFVVHRRLGNGQAQPLLPGDAVQGGGITEGNAGMQFDFSHGIPSTPGGTPAIPAAAPRPGAAAPPQ